MLSILHFLYSKNINGIDSLVWLCLGTKNTWLSKRLTDPKGAHVHPYQVERSATQTCLVIMAEVYFCTSLHPGGALNSEAV